MSATPLRITPDIADSAGRFMSILLSLSIAQAIASPAEKSSPLPSPPPLSFRAVTYNVRDFGATGDGKTTDTAAINKAVERCSSEGGGDVIFPSGTYLSATIRLRSHVRLVIPPDTVIQAAPSGYDLPEANPNNRFQDFGHSHFHNALFRGENIECCAVTGDGEINGKGLAIFDPKQPDIADKIFSIVSGKNIRFDGIHLKNGGHFAWLLNDCENVTISGVILKGSRDAIDLMGCWNVEIHGCDFSSCIDDTLGIKSDWALGRKIETRNVRVWDCDFDSGCNALQFGSETAGDFHDVSIRDIRIHRAEKAGIGITTNDGGGHRRRHVPQHHHGQGGEPRLHSRHQPPQERRPSQATRHHQ